MKTFRHLLLILTAAVPGFLAPALHAQVPSLLNHQGRVAVDGVNFDGSGSFKFALVNAAGTIAYWTNDGTHLDGTEPTAAVSLTVTKGLYSVLLGDTALANMTAVPATVFNNADVRLRVWFNDGTTGSQLLTPDQRFAASGYSMIAGNVPDGAITGAKLATGSVTTAKIAAGAITNTELATGAVANANLANSGITVTAGTGLGGGGAVALGGTVTLTNAGVLSLTGGGGITVNAATGTITLGSNATSANTPSTIVLRDASGNFSAGTITGNVSGSAASFTGNLAGDVTGTQGATVVASVGGVSAANVAAGANLANAATTTNTPNTIVKRDSSGNIPDIQTSLITRKIALWSAQGNNTTVDVLGFSNVTTGTTTIRNVGTANLLTSTRRVGFVSSSVAGSSAGTRHGAGQFVRGNAPGLGGFLYVARFGMSSASLVATQRSFVGLNGGGSLLLNVEPSSNVNIIGFGVDSVDNTWSFIHNDGTGIATKEALTGTFPPRDSGSSGTLFEVRIYCQPNSSTIQYSIEVLGGGSYFAGSTSVDLPSNTILLGPQIWTNNGPTSLGAGIDVVSQYLETTY